MDILNISTDFTINQSKNSFPKVTFEDESEKIILNINKRGEKKNKFYTALLVLSIAIISYYIWIFLKE